MVACFPDERYLAGLVGAGIATSLRSTLHEREAGHLGLGRLYQVVELEHAARRLAFPGPTVTHPFKRSVLCDLDELAPEAAAVGRPVGA